MPYKYAPENDYLLAEIARGIGKCQLVFFSATPVELSQKLEKRLTKVFADRSLRFADYAVFIRWQPRDAFFALMKHASIFLDTIGYSGFTTAMQAAQCGLPIVTREGKFMRGRFSSGILKRMGVTELIAQTGQEYIDIAVRIATDKNYLMQLRQRLQDQSKLVFHDIEPTAALGRILVEKVKEQREHS
jgi:predicted O-linked N-acetylglucosamine transferase (SPINDLY family)